MAAASILATNTTAANSADITLTAATLVALKAAADGSTVFIEVKDDGGAYVVVDRLTSSANAKQLLPGVYRFRRPLGPSCGVFQAA